MLKDIDSLAIPDAATVTIPDESSTEQLRLEAIPALHTIQKNQHAEKLSIQLGTTLNAIKVRPDLIVVFFWYLLLVVES